MSMRALREGWSSDFREIPRFPVTVVCGESRTRQSMKSECDINNIVARFKRTGVLSPVRAGSGVYLDVSTVGDYREACDRVRSADRMFMKLPAKVRAVFGNDPSRFLDAVVDPRRKSELEDLGVFEKAPATPADSLQGETGSEGA